MSESETLKSVLEEASVAKEMGTQVRNIPDNIMEKVIEYCKEHVKANDSRSDAAKEALRKFDSEFLKVDKITLFGLIRASDYLNIKSLHELTCQCVADMISDKSPEYIRTFFGIKNDYTPEEEEQVRSEIKWAFI